jgi:hypothetical protein
VVLPLFAELPLLDDPLAELPLLDDPLPELPLLDDPLPELPLLDDPLPDAPLPESPEPDAPLPDVPEPVAPAPESPLPDAPAPEFPLSGGPPPGVPVLGAPPLAELPLPLLAVIAAAEAPGFAPPHPIRYAGTEITAKFATINTKRFFFNIIELFSVWAVAAFNKASWSRASRTPRLC